MCVRMLSRLALLARSDAANDIEILTLTASPDQDVSDQHLQVHGRSAQSPCSVGARRQGSLRRCPR
jgi:hypothetical protein